MGGETCSTFASAAAPTLGSRKFATELEGCGEVSGFAIGSSCISYGLKILAWLLLEHRNGGLFTGQEALPIENAPLDFACDEAVLFGHVDLPLGLEYRPSPS